MSQTLKTYHACFHLRGEPEGVKCRVVKKRSPRDAAQAFDNESGPAIVTVQPWHGGKKSRYSVSGSPARIRKIR